MRRRYALLVALSLFAFGIGSAPLAAQVPTPVAINEVRTDQPSTDNDEYVEFIGAAETSLDGYTFIAIGDGAATAGSGVLESVTSLNGQTIPADGFFVAAESTFTLGTADLVTTTRTTTARSTSPRGPRSRTASR